MGWCIFIMTFEVKQKDNYKILFGNNTVQSVMNMKDPLRLVVPYTEAFREIANDYFPFNDVLFLGGGACLVPRAFVATFNCTCDIVEIDSNVIQIAKKEFGFIPSKVLNVFIDDAYHFLRNIITPYDIIIQDAYSGFEIPLHLQTEDHFMQILKHLNKHGVILLNYFGKKNETFDKLETRMSSIFSTFRTVQVTPINPQGENYIMVGEK